MGRPIPVEQLKAIEEVVRRHAGGVTIHEIARELGTAVAGRTLQSRLRSLVDARRLVMQGEGRGAKYRVPLAVGHANLTLNSARVEDTGEVSVPLSPEGEEIRAYLRQPVARRKPVGYDRAFLES